MLAPLALFPVFVGKISLDVHDPVANACLRWSGVVDYVHTAGERSCFDPEGFLEASRLDPFKIFQRRSPRSPKSRPDGPVLEVSGLAIEVSGAEWSDLPTQVADAERFLEAHRDDIQQLARAPCVTDFMLDFPIELRMHSEDVAPRIDRLPATLVRLAGALGLALELSTYPCRDE